MNIKKKTDCKYIVLLLIFMAFIAACSDHNHPTDILENLGAPDISCGLGGIYPSTVSTRNMKKETSLTPFKSALKIFIFEFSDSADALVSLSMK